MVFCTNFTVMGPNWFTTYGGMISVDRGRGLVGIRTDGDGAGITLDANDANLVLILMSRTQAEACHSFGETYHPRCR